MWADRSEGAAPPAAAGTLFAYDSNADRFVLFGGWNGSNLNETWSWNPSTGRWADLAPPSSPPARADAMFVFDPHANDFLLFGGWTEDAQGTTHRFNDTWTFSLSADRWAQLDPRGAPSARSDGATVFDPTDDEMLVFGGFSGSTYLGDAWAFHPATDTWVALSSGWPSPGPRADGRLVWDPVDQEAVLFGGNDFSGPNFTFHHLRDTWTYHPSTGRWTPVIALAAPAARDYAFEGFDPVTGLVLLFGGFGPSVMENDTWAFSPENGTWSPIAGPRGPPPRYAGGGAFDARDGVFVVTGGLGTAGLLNDTWVLTSKLVPYGPASPIPPMLGLVAVGAGGGVVVARIYAGRTGGPTRR